VRAAVISAAGSIVAALLTCFATLGAGHLQGHQIPDVEWRCCQSCSAARGLPGGLSHRRAIYGGLNAAHAMTAAPRHSPVP
jgi:hypothetical protein